MDFLYVIVFLDGGLMAGLVAMILLVRRSTRLANAPNNQLAIHACGLLLYTGIPFANFVAAHWLSQRNGGVDEDVENMLRFQITIYLYLLVACLLITTLLAAPIGIAMIPLLLLFHLLISLAAIFAIRSGKRPRYRGALSIGT